MLDKEKIIQILREIKPKLKEKYGFEALMLYGSYVKNEATVGSDLDIAVKVDNSFKTLKNYINAKEDLEQLFNLPIDLVYFDTMNPIIKLEVEKECITVE